MESDIRVDLLPLYVCAYHALEHSHTCIYTLKHMSTSTNTIVKHTQRKEIIKYIEISLCCVWNACVMVCQEQSKESFYHTESEDPTSVTIFGWKYRITEPLLQTLLKFFETHFECNSETDKRYNQMHGNQNKCIKDELAKADFSSIHNVHIYLHTIYISCIPSH